MRHRALGRSSILALVAAAAPFVSGASALAQEFTYNPPGTLAPGSGEGRVDNQVYVPGMRFPIEQPPAYANSQVWGDGGMDGPGGSQCDPINYAYPWWDNYCETRTWDMPLCPAGVGHQGDDVRPRSCQDDTHWTVAVEDGTITYIGTYSINLTTADGTIKRYLHQQTSSLVVSVGDVVHRGDRIGRVSNNFGASSTTIHLHFDIFMNVENVGFVYVPPYLSLVQAYQTLLGQESCTPVPAAGGIIDNRDSCFVLHGPPATWRYVDSEGYNGDLYWSYTWENAASNWAEWVFEVAESGEYDVSVYLSPDYTQSQQTRYTVLAGQDETELHVDQSSGDGWLSIGSFEFAAGTSQRVAVYDGPGEALSLQRQFEADAIRLTRLDGPEAAPDAGPEPDAGAPDAGAPDVAPDVDTTIPDAGADPSTEPSALDTGGDDSTGQQPSANDQAVSVNSGCGCAVTSRTPVGAGWLLGLFGLGAVLRGRRRRGRSA